MTAEEIMTTDVVTVGRDEPLSRAMALLAELDVRHLPVVDQGALAGMVSDRDLREAGLFAIPDDEGDVAQFQALQSRAVSEAMHTDVVTVTPETTIAEMIDLMVEQRVGALPVVDEQAGGLAGIVSYVDVLKAAAAALAE